MNPDWKDKLARYLTGVSVFGIVIGGMLLILPQHTRFESLKKTDAELSAQIELKRRQITELGENQRRFKTDPDFVEQIARKVHNRVMPGELVFLFENE